MKKGLQEDLQVIEGIGDIFFKKKKKCKTKIFKYNWQMKSSCVIYLEWQTTGGLPSMWNFLKEMILLCYSISVSLDIFFFVPS